MNRTKQNQKNPPRKSKTQKNRSNWFCVLLTPHSSLTHNPPFPLTPHTLHAPSLASLSLSRDCPHGETAGSPALPLTSAAPPCPHSPPTATTAPPLSTATRHSSLSHQRHGDSLSPQPQRRSGFLSRRWQQRGGTLLFRPCDRNYDFAVRPSPLHLRWQSIRLSISRQQPVNLALSLNRPLSLYVSRLKAIFFFWV